MLSLRDRERLAGALERGRRPRGWRRLSVTRYLGVAALAYDAAFPDLAALSPCQKYERRADQRHGGMLDLPPNDAAGFARWHASRDWLGAHPWEIVFAHPHGILLSPHRVGGSWRFFLSVDTLGLYVETARMAMALGSAGVPFELQHAQKIISALRGEDWVEVGPFHGQLSLDELAQRRPEARDLVRWDPPPRLRVRRAEGTPP